MATVMTVDVHTGRRVRLQLPPYPGAECFDLSYQDKQVLLWLATISAGSPSAVFGCFVETGNKTVSIGLTSERAILSRFRSLCLVPSF